MESNSTKTKPIDRDGIVAALRRQVEAAGGKRITLRHFLTSTGLSNEDIVRNFARWEDVYSEAGYKFRRPNAYIEESLLLEDWGRATRELQKRATKTDYAIKGNYSGATLEARFGSWKGVYAAFRSFAKDKPQWADIKSVVDDPPQREAKYRVFPGKRPSRAASHLAKGRRAPDQPWGRRLPKQPLYGARLDSGLLQHAPVNESGVILLFGSMAERLGFLVEVMRMGFPDCEAKRLVGPDLWEKLHIEFEYQSRNFRLHKHDPKACDVIVCWEHNWPDCPKTLEVIALKDEVARLAAAA